jgi:hypothetical protein
MLVGLRSTTLILVLQLLNKKLKSPFNIKEKLNKEKPLFNSFSFLKVLSNLIKG